MEINVIRGGIGSGKSDKCIEMIKMTRRSHPEAKCIMLVPNYNSYETEKRFVDEFGGTGLNNIEVMTFRRLAMTLLTKSETNYITDSGRQMLIRKAVVEYCKKFGDEQDKRLIATIKKSGFSDVMASLISEFKRYTVTPDDLEEKSEYADDKLSGKMQAAAGIYRIYSEYAKNSGYTDSEDDNKRLAEHILKGDYFDADTYLWVDKFSEFTPQQIDVLRAAAKQGTHITVTVSYPSDYNDVYAPMKSMMNRIDDLTDEFGMGEITDTGSEFKHKKSAEVEWLLKNWGKADAVWENETEDIVYFSARDIYNEVETIACKIADLTHEDNLRYRDIAILCGDTEEYNHIIETVFDEYKIPYFTDSTITLSDHPIAMQVLSLFDIFEKDWQYEDVFCYLKSGFIYTETDGKIRPSDSEKIDFLENYVLKYGIRGKKRWLSEWTKNTSIFDAAFAFDESTVNADTVKANEIRKEVTKPLERLSEKVNGTHTADYFARAVFELLRDIKLDYGLKYEISVMRNDGDLNGADRFARLWNLMLEVLTQTTVVLKDDEITFAEFGEYVNAGFCACGIRTIPSGIDRVHVGSVEKSSAHEVKALFVAGAKDGCFPNVIPKEGYFSNADRKTLEEKCGITIAPDSKKKAEKQYFKVYAAMCAASDKLYLSRPMQSSDGNVLSKSSMITDIEDLFPKLRNTNVEKLDKSKPDKSKPDKSKYIYISTPEATIHKTLLKKRSKNPIWKAAYEWYKEHDEWKNILSLTDRAQWYMYSDIKLNEDLANKLYKDKTRYSASRLNVFAKCPFEYFMQYGLRLKERKIWDIAPTDVGNYAHEVIRLFCDTVENGAKSAEEKIAAWRNLTDEDRVKTLDEIIEKTCENTLSNKLRDKEKTASIYRRTGKNIKNAAITVHHALSQGKYVEVGMERDFSVLMSDDIEIHGKIDRVDALSGEHEIKLRVVDYKTGGTEFNVVNIVNGIDMQLVVYAMAAKKFLSEESGKNARITGIYYNKVHNKSVRVSLEDDGTKTPKKKKDEIKLNGVTFVSSDDDLDDITPEKDCDFIELKKVRSAEEIDALTEKVRENIISIDKRIKDGEISCTPYKNGSEDSCTYCNFSDICSFGNKIIPRQIQGKEETVWRELTETKKSEE